jgi:hypothetical protein
MLPDLFFDDSSFWCQRPGHSAGDVHTFAYDRTNMYQVCHNVFIHVACYKLIVECCRTHHMLERSSLQHSLVQGLKYHYKTLS